MNRAHWDYLPLSDETFSRMKGPERERMPLSARLSREGALIRSPRISTIVCDFGDFDNVARLRSALDLLGSPPHIAWMNDCANPHKPSGRPLALFRRRMTSRCRWERTWSG